MMELFGKAGGFCGGRGGSMHIADFSVGMLGANGVVAAGIPIAVGAAHAVKVRGGKEIVSCCPLDFPGRIVLPDNPSRGDVAVFKYPGDQGQGFNRTDYIKRIVGMPGDRIKMTNGLLYINGKAVKKQLLAHNDTVEIGKYKIKYLVEDGVDYEKTMIMKPGGAMPGQPAVSSEEPPPFLVVFQS